MATAGTCTSMWYCPPETLVPTHRVWRHHKYDFVQVCTNVFGEGSLEVLAGGWSIPDGPGPP